MVNCNSIVMYNCVASKPKNSLFLTDKY